MTDTTYLIKFEVPGFFDHLSLRSTDGADWYYRLTRAGSWLRSSSTFGTLPNGLRPASSLTTAVTNYLSMTDSTGATWQVYPEAVTGALQIVSSGITGTAKTVSTGITLRSEEPGEKYRRHVSIFGKHTSYSTNSTATTETKRFSISGDTVPIFDGSFWQPRVSNPINVEWRLFATPGAVLGSRAIPRFGVMDVFIGDSESEDLLDFAWDSRSMILYRGTKDLLIGGFAKGFGTNYERGSAILKTRTRSARWDYDTLSISLSDTGADIVVRPIASIYRGTGGFEGPEEMAGVSKPLGFGNPKNVTPALISSTDNIYQVHDGSIQAVDVVYDQGIALIPAGDVADLSGIGTVLDWQPVEGQYVTDKASGLFRLGAPPEGIVTADFRGSNTGTAGYARTASTIVRKIAVDYGELDESLDLNSDSFVNVEADNNSNLSYYVPPGANLAIGTVFDEVMSSVGGFWGFDDFNRLKVGIVQLGTSIRMIEEKDYVSISRNSPDTPPVYRLSIGYNRSWTVLDDTDLAGAVPPILRSFVTQQFRYATTENIQIQERRKLSEAITVNALFDRKEDAVIESARRFDLLSVDRDIYQVSGMRDKQYLIEVGDTVTLKSPRFKLAAGRQFFVIGRVENAELELTDLTLWG